MHWLGGNKETSIKQIEFKSFGRAGSQRASPGNGFGLHWDSPGPPLQSVNKGGGWGGRGQRGANIPPLPIHTHPPWIHVWPTSSSLTGGISKQVRLSFHPTPTQTPQTLRSPHQILCPLHPILAHSKPWAPCGTHRIPALALSGPTDVKGATGCQSRKEKSQLLGRAVGSGGSGGSEPSLGTGAIPSCPSAQL